MSSDPASLDRKVKANNGARKDTRLLLRPDFQKNFAGELVKHTLDSKAGICPTYMTREEGKRVPRECKGCEGYNLTCSYYQIYLASTTNSKPAQVQEVLSRNVL